MMVLSIIKHVLMMIFNKVETYCTIKHTVVSTVNTHLLAKIK